MELCLLLPLKPFVKTFHHLSSSDKDVETDFLSVSGWYYH